MAVTWFRYLLPHYQSIVVFVVINDYTSLLHNRSQLFFLPFTRLRCPDLSWITSQAMSVRPSAAAAPAPSPPLASASTAAPLEFEKMKFKKKIKSRFSTFSKTSQSLSRSGLRPLNFSQPSSASPFCVEYASACRVLRCPHGAGRNCRCILYHHINHINETV